MIGSGAEFRSSNPFDKKVFLPLVLCEDWGPFRSLNFCKVSMHRNFSPQHGYKFQCSSIIVI